MDRCNGTRVMCTRAPWSLFDLHVTDLLKSSKLIVELTGLIVELTGSQSISIDVCLSFVGFVLVLCSYSVCLFVFVRLFVLTTVYLMMYFVCFANWLAVVHWFWRWCRLRKVKRQATIRNRHNQIPHPALKSKREITKYINWRQFTKGTRGKPNEQLFPK